MRTLPLIAEFYAAARLLSVHVLSVQPRIAIGLATLHHSEVLTNTTQDCSI